MTIYFQSADIPLMAPAMVGDFGAAMMTVISIVGVAIFGGYTFSFASHAFMMITEGTAAGQDEIAWPAEPLVDRIGKTAVMGWVFLVCGSIPFLLGKIIAGEGVGTWIFTLAGFGLLFPVVVLSIQSSNTLLGIISPAILGRLAKRPEYWASYYLAVAPVLAVAGVGLWAGFRFPMAVVFLSAFIVAACLLIASRLLGRLALLVGRVGLKRREKPTDDDKPFDLGEVADIAAGRPGRHANRTHSPYGIRSGKSSEPTSVSPTPSLKRIWIEEGADDPYALVGSEPPAPELPKEFAQPSEYEMKLAMRSQPVRPPKHPWLAGTYTFPFNPANWPTLIWLTMGLSISAIFARVIVAAS